MNTDGSIGIAAGILVIGSLLIAATASSILMNEPTNLSADDLEKKTDEIIDELCSYLQIKDMVGKYYSINNQQKIQKIAILVSPLISHNIDLSTLKIKLNNGNEIRVLSYSGEAEFIKEHSLFEHVLWNMMASNEFSFIITHDKDGSILRYDTLNSQTDMTYVIIELSEDFLMKKGDVLEITLLPSAGYTRTITIEAPLPIKSIVTF